MSATHCYYCATDQTLLPPLCGDCLSEVVRQVLETEEALVMLERGLAARRRERNE